MKVLVVGSKGMLGTDLVEACLEAGHRTIGKDLDELDIRDYQELKSAMPAAEVVVNCAAFTRVDEAETKRDEAYSVNAEGARNLMLVCKKKKIRLIQLSTDYVFDGTRKRPYTERDRTCPISIYGASKLAGEKAVRAIGAHFLVIRTQALFGKHGHNFVKSILKQLSECDEPLRVVNDQRMAPTYTRHLAQAITNLIKAQAEGVVHVAASGECTWFEFAQAIAQRVKPGAEVVPISTSELDLPASRPPYAILDTRRYRTLTGQVMPTWEQGLEEYLVEEGVVAA